VRREQIISGEVYNKSAKKASTSITSWLTSTIYSTIFGESESDKIQVNDEQELVSMEYLKKKAESIIQWAALVNKEIISER
jgi:hypothetical protein